MRKERYCDKWSIEKHSYDSFDFFNFVLFVFLKFHITSDIRVCIQ